MTATSKRRMLLTSLVLVGLAAPARAQETRDRNLSPYFLVEGREAAAGSFPLRSTGVVVNIDGVIADVIVTQTYANQGTEPINARYVFPGSTHASVHGMRIRIGDQVVAAKIKRREEARHEFEAAKARGKSASLLEQQRPNVFTMDVANILPEDRVEVELHYTELLIPTEGTYQFVYPTVVGPRYTNGSAAEGTGEDRWLGAPYLHHESQGLGTAEPTLFDLRATVSAGLPLQDVASPSHRVNVDWDGEALARVTLADPSDLGGNRDFVLDYRLSGNEIQSGLLLYQGADENFFLLMVQPPDRVRTEEIPPREYLFVLDVSGSMNGFPLETAKSLIRDLIGHLRPTDRFDVVLFSGGSRVLAPESLPATEQNARMAIRIIDQEQGGGGTELVGALRTALALPRDEKFSRTVVVITDGYIAAERDVFDLIRKNLNRTNFFSFGIGSGVNRYLVEGLARAGMGEPFVVTSPVEAPAAASRFRDYIESPVLTNLRVSFDGFDAYDVEPPALPDLFAERPIVLLGKWRGGRVGEIEVSGEGGARRYARRFSVSDSRPLVENAALRYLWARTRISRLSDYGSGPEDAGVVEQIVSLGLSYSLLTKHTSFIAVIEKVRNTDVPARDVDQPLPLPQGVSDLAVGRGYAAGAEPEVWIVLVAASLMLALAALWRRWRTAQNRWDGRAAS